MAESKEEQQARREQESRDRQDRQFREDRDEHLSAGRVDDWQVSTLIYADWLDDLDTEASRSRAATLRAEADTKCPPRPSKWPRAEGIQGLTDHQREQLAVALRRPFGVLCGSPGTGKTHTIAALVKRLPASSTAVCATTGKAASRLAQALREAGCSVDMRADTIHQLLGIGRAGYDGGGWSFVHDESNPLPHRFVIVDEAPMLSTDLASDLLRACRPGRTHVLMVGDPDQLPPVGHGAPLRDWIASGAVSVGRLVDVHRNAGAIAAACKAMREGEQDRAVGFATVVRGEIDLNDAWRELKPETNWMHFEAGSPERASECLRHLLGQLGGNGSEDSRGLHPTIQILAPVREKGELSCKAVNRLCQELLNPDDEIDSREVRAWGTTVRPGDRVVCLHNHYAADASTAAPRSLPGGIVSAGRSRHYIANGETGVVVSTGEGAERRIVGRFENPNRTVYLRRGDDADFGLGYCLTVHKCVHPDTLVETQNGLQRIRELAGLAGGMVAVPDGRVLPWTEFHENPSGSALRITTKDGYGVTVTPDHKLEVWDGRSYTLREARDINPRDVLRLRLGAVASPGVPTMQPRPAADIRSVQWGLPGVMSAELAEFIGLMVADGTIYRNGFRLAKRHIEVVNRFVWLCERLFGCTPKRIEIHGTPAAEVNSALIADWLLSVGGMAPEQKAVPTCVLRSPIDMQAAFLRGLFEDGTVHLNRRLDPPVADHIEWSTAYPLMAETVRVMLLRLGIIAGTVRSSSRSAETILLYSDAVRRFRDCVGFISKMKQDRLSLDSHTDARSKVPATDEDIRPLRRQFRQAGRLHDYQNALERGAITRRVASWLATHPDTPEANRETWGERLSFHHDCVASIEETIAPSMCLTVPEAGRFLQNGFAGSNSQGSEWPVVIVVLDDKAGSFVMGREWMYTAISRARSLCITIGRLGCVRRAVGDPKLTSRKTFLAERIQEEVRRAVASA